MRDTECLDDVRVAAGASGRQGEGQEGDQDQHYGRRWAAEQSQPLQEHRGIQSVQAGGVSSRPRMPQRFLYMRIPRTADSPINTPCPEIGCVDLKLRCFLSLICFTLLGSVGVGGCKD